MDQDIVTVKLTDKIDYCMDVMTSKRIRHLPVLSDDQVVGIISIGDVVKAIIDIQKTTINYLDSYITGTKNI
ncbi:CBS domain protein [compost metagenome]